MVVGLLRYADHACVRLMVEDCEGGGAAAAARSICPHRSSVAHHEETMYPLLVGHIREEAHSETACTIRWTNGSFLEKRGKFR